VRGLVDSCAVVTGRPSHVMFLVLARAADAEITGAVPKAASLRGLRCAPDPAGWWSCAVTVEV
jgi:hypothetical protein